jgi:membrane-bound serine protease (ClpP class)
MIATLILFLHLSGFIPADETINFLYISGALLLIAELFVTSMGMLALNGCIALFIAYALQTGDSTLMGIPIDWPFLFGVATLEIVLIGVTVMVYLHYRNKKVTTGLESMIGDTGEVVDWNDGKGRVRVQGEVWNAVCPTPLTKDEKIRVNAVTGLVLTVEKA